MKMITKVEIISYLNEKYDSESITQLIDDEICSGNWVSEEDIEENDCEDEFDWYEQFGRGEAEDAVRKQIDEEILSHFGFGDSYEKYNEEIGENVWETTVEVFPDLDGKL